MLGRGSHPVNSANPVKIPLASLRLCVNLPFFTSSPCKDEEHGGEWRRNGTRVMNTGLLWKRKLIIRFLTAVLSILCFLIAQWFFRPGFIVRYESYDIQVPDKSNWFDALFVVHSTTKPESIQVKGKQTLGFGGDTQAAVFRTESGNIWAGPVMEFYIETATGILGGSVKETKVLLHESKYSRRDFEKQVLNEIARRFEKEFCLIRWRKKPGRWAIEPKCFDDRPIDDENMASGPLAFCFDLSRERDAVQVIGDTLRLKLGSFGGTSTSLVVWIDVNSKKLLKAQEHGNQVFPKRWWLW
jgi:hypothetical protein